MRFKHLDLNLLVALDALLRKRNVSRAAAEVNLSQSAMSNALARLRDYFNDQLLIQVGRKMELTPRAETLVEPVRDILLRINTAIEVQPEFIAAESSRSFNLMVSEYTTAVLMPSLAAIVSRASNNIGIRLLPQTASPEELLNSGDADLLIMPSLFLSKNHPSEPLYEDGYTCVVWEGSAAFGETMSAEDYLRASHVVADFRPGHMSFEGWFLREQGVERRVAVSTPSLLTACALVVETDWVATVHSRIARMAALNTPIRPMRPPFEIPTLVQAMQWHKSRTEDLGLTWLRQRLQEAAARIGPTRPIVAWN